MARKPGAEGVTDWSEVAKGMLKAELKRRGMTYANLVEALAKVGVSENEANLRNKISRGNFSAAFLLQALNAIGCHLMPVSPTGAFITVPHSLAESHVIHIPKKLGKE